MNNSQNKKVIHKVYIGHQKNVNDVLHKPENFDNLIKVWGAVSCTQNKVAVLFSVIDVENDFPPVKNEEFYKIIYGTDKDIQIRLNNVYIHDIVAFVKTGRIFNILARISEFEQVKKEESIIEERRIVEIKKRGKKKESSF